MSEPNETIELAGPASDRWYRTQIPDWIALNPNLKDGSFRLYCVLRALVLEKQKNRIRVLSHEQIAFLAVGKNGKPASLSSVKALLANLQEVGLVSNPDGSRIVTSSGPGTIQSRRRYQLADWPKDRAAYEGWMNAFDKLDAFTDDWREARTDVFQGRVDSQKSDLDSQKSDDDSQKTGVDGQKSVENPAPTSGDVPSLKEFPEGVSSSPGATGVPRAEGVATAPSEEEENFEENNNPTTPADSHLTGQELKAAAIVASKLADANGGPPTPEEIPAVLQEVRDQAAKTGKNIFAIDVWVTNRPVATLKRDLAAVRARARASAPASSSAPSKRSGGCVLHPMEELPCLSCKGDLSGGREEAQRVVDLYLSDPDARPDLKNNRYIQRALAAA